MTINAESTAPNSAVRNGKLPNNDGKKIMDKTTKKNAPALIPKVPGDARGFFVNVCKIAPDTAKAPPANIPMTSRGSRKDTTISCILPSTHTSFNNWEAVNSACPCVKWMMESTKRRKKPPVNVTKDLFNLLILTINKSPTFVEFGLQMFQLIKVHHITM